MPQKNKFIILYLLFFCAHSFGLDISNLEKFRSVITTEFKGYDISSTEHIQLYGAKHRKFITNQWYWERPAMAHYLENDPGIWKVGCLLATCPTDHGIVFLMFVFLQVLGGRIRPTRWWLYCSPNHWVRESHIFNAIFYDRAWLHAFY